MRLRQQAQIGVLPFLAALAALNLAWEALQVPLYTIWQRGTWGEIIFAVAHCTAGDVIISFFGISAALVLARWRWPRSAKECMIFAAAFIGFGLAYTVFSEWLNVTVRKSWVYSALMPVIPPLDTCLSPVLQWIVVPILAFWLARRDWTTDRLQLRRTDAD